MEGYTGNLFIQYQVDEVRRVSDLAKLSTDLSLNVRYVPYGISSLTQQIADITISTDYDPMSENYDFPLVLVRHGIPPMFPQPLGQEHLITSHHSRSQLLVQITQIGKLQMLASRLIASESKLLTVDVMHLMS